MIKINDDCYIAIKQIVAMYQVEVDDEKYVEFVMTNGKLYHSDKSLKYFVAQFNECTQKGQEIF